MRNSTTLIAVAIVAAMCTASAANAGADRETAVTTVASTGWESPGSTGGEHHNSTGWE